MRYDFMILDVFTDKAFGGNQLAVLTDARRLTADAMQTIAREFDYPETTFVLPPNDPAHARKVRIFTPGGELPFAGHPTIGTACALVMSGQSEFGQVVSRRRQGERLPRPDRGLLYDQYGVCRAIRASVSRPHHGCCGRPSTRCSDRDRTARPRLNPPEGQIPCAMIS